jgi:hypothetical protein
MAVAGDGLLHPVPIAAIGLLLLNDHFLKAQFPGPLTGKVSDFAGLVFFPLFLQACWEVALRLAGRDSIASPRVLAASIAVTAVIFVGIKINADVNHVYVAVLGWLYGVATSIGQGAARTTSVAAMDVTDLLALPALLIPLGLGLRRSGQVPHA